MSSSTVSVGPFEGIVRAILHQQVSGIVAKKTCARLVDLSGGRFPDEQAALRLGAEGIKGCGTTMARAETIVRVATAFAAAPSLDRLYSLGDEEIRTTLCKIRGVGNWTVDMLLLFCKGSPDIFLGTDLGIRKAIGNRLGLGRLATPEEAAAWGETMRPNRSTACLMLWKELPGFPEPGIV